jgi:hypothetical protein
MRLEAALSPGEGEKHLGDAVADIGPHDVFYKKPRQENSEGRVNRKEIAGGAGARAAGEEVLNEMNGVFQGDGAEGGGEPHQEAGQEKKVLFLKPPPPAGQEFQNEPLDG